MARSLEIDSSTLRHAQCSLLAAATLTLAGVLALHAPRPVQASRSQKAHGALLYKQTGCAHCHGSDLRGSDLGPDLSTIGKQWPKPQIEHQIVHGGGGMPPFADTLQRDELTDLVEFLHSKRKAPKGPRPPNASASPPASSPSEPERN